MLSLFRKKQAISARIDDHAILVQAKETLLEAALRQSIRFPNSCRVGSCGSCKCRLIEGQVKELTETAYTLSEKELKAGFILACQAVPLSDLRVELRSRKSLRLPANDEVTGSRQQHENSPT